MRGSFEGVKFRGKWRNYQKRILDEIETHLEDGHLHIVAAPGSGKTILGLEVMRLLNKPALILSPTIAIRDQWAARFASYFCKDESFANDNVSCDIKNPALVTVSTYQGLHSAYKGRPEKEAEEPEEDAEDGDAEETCGEELSEEDAEDEGVDEETEENKKAAKPAAGAKAALELLGKLQKAGIETLVVDEAHHLRSEWWKCLQYIKNHMENIVIVALTATPPYDVSPQEWERYKELCGPVDSEISIPELVKEKNLCPHQDLVILSQPLTKEKEMISELRSRMRQFTDELKADADFNAALENCPHVLDPKRYEDEILRDPGFYSCLLAFVKRGRGNKKLLHILGINSMQLPALTPEAVDVLLSGCFKPRTGRFDHAKEVMESIEKSLRRIGGMERNRVCTSKPGRVSKLLINSISKLNSIAQIAESECGIMKENLRMVVLSDFIRYADMPESSGDLKEIKRMGVVPVFEILRRKKIPGAKLGILSGSLIVIPAGAKQALIESAKKNKVKKSDVSLSVLKHDRDFLKVGLKGVDGHKLTAVITEVFGKGEITILVGTKSLLGEGWDAPSANSLILASVVGSYMLSNQMRGRAIRVQDGNPGKTANIWHLACVEDNATQGGEDYAMLARRFKAFSGVGNNDNIICSGTARLGLKVPPFSPENIMETNHKMFELASGREILAARWDRALNVEGKKGYMGEEVNSPVGWLRRKLVFENTLYALLMAIGMLLFMGFNEYAELIFRMIKHSGSAGASGFLLILVGLVLFYPAKAIFMAIRLFFLHAPVESSMTQIGLAVVRTMCKFKILKQDYRVYKVCAERQKNTGAVSCWLEGGTTYEKSVFLDAMEEILGPIENPRYLIERRTMLFFLGRKDYHNVPAVLAQNKRYALEFFREWKNEVSPAALIYCRSAEGRKKLLKARVHSSSGVFLDESERMEVWR